MKTFADILSEKLSFKNEKPSVSLGNHEVWIEQLSLQPVRFSVSGKTSYPHVAAQKASWSPAHLSEPFRSSFEFFHGNGVTYLTEHSSHRVLKRAFRELALKLHPDRVIGSRSTSESEKRQAQESFLALQKHNKIVLRFFDTRAKSAAA